MAADERMELKIHGRVQGVAFRWYARSTALALGLTGWVRNQPDGSVRMVAEGPPEALDALLRWARRGPDRARVDRVEEFRSEPAGNFDTFEITG